MAALTFTLPSGDRQTFTLYSDRRMRIGRERSNDIVLRDARISRSHAEVTFERGFYVIRDLGSSNGTWVNGREVRTAPLTDGAEIRLGSCTGQFTEEVPELPTAPPTPPAPARSELPDPSADLADAAAEGPGRTRLSPKLDPSAIPEEPPTEDMGKSDDEKDSGTRERPAPPELDRSWSVFAETDQLEGRVTENDAVIAVFRSVWGLASLITPVLAGIMLFSGFGATLLLMIRGDLIAGLAATTLTAVFTWSVLTLSPRRIVEIWRDEDHSELLMRIEQASIAPVPSLRLEILDRNRETIGWLVRPITLLRRSVRWRIAIEGPRAEPVAELVRQTADLVPTLTRRPPVLALMANDIQLAEVEPGSPTRVRASSRIPFDDRTLQALAVSIRAFA